MRENDGGYCFEMPAADVTIAVAYAKAPGGLPGRAVALIAVGGAVVAAGGVVLGLWLWKKKTGGGRGGTCAPPRPRPCADREKNRVIFPEKIDAGGGVRVYYICWDIFPFI